MTTTKHRPKKRSKSQLKHRVCTVCGKGFTAPRAHARTCSPTCRKRLNRFLVNFKAAAPRIPLPAALAALAAGRVVMQAVPSTRRPAPGRKSPRPLHSPKARNKKTAAR